LAGLTYRAYHDGKHSSSASKEETWHQTEGGFLKPIIFGGLDGILTSFAIVAGAAGGGLSPQVVMVLGFSNIFADALRLVSAFKVFLMINAREVEPTKLV